MRFEDRGHDYIFGSDELLAYIDEFNEAFHEYFGEEEFTAEERAEYIHANLDRDRWCDALDEDLYEQILDFYDENLE